MSTKKKSTEVIASPFVDAESTAQILDLLAAGDDGSEELTVAQMAELGERLAAKPDGNHYILDEIKLRTKQIRLMEKQLSAAKKSLASKEKNMKAYLAYHMLKHKLEAIPGMLWKIRLTSSSKVVPKRDATPLDAMKYAPYVRTKYEWDKDALDAALSLNEPDPLALEVASLQTTNSVTFDPYKGRILDESASRKDRRETRLLENAQREQGPDSQGSTEAPNA